MGNKRTHLNSKYLCRETVDDCRSVHIGIYYTGHTKTPVHMSLCLHHCAAQISHQPRHPQVGAHGDDERDVSKGEVDERRVNGGRHDILARYRDGDDSAGMGYGMTAPAGPAAIGSFI